jgi:predicted small secreted protein
MSLPMPRRLRLLLLLLALLPLGACHTIQGAGRDIQRAGEVIEDSARH